MNSCPVHNLPFRLIPAGTSKKTGRSYTAFWACPERGCPEKPEEGKTPTYTPSPSMNVKPYIPNPALVKEEPDWEKITEGKVRHGVVCAMLQAGRSKEEILEDYEMWTRLIIIGSPI